MFLKPSYFISTLKDLFSIGITALGPRKKIIHALSELRKESAHVVKTHPDMHACSEAQRQNTNGLEIHNDASDRTIEDTKKLAANKLITDYFPGSAINRKKVNTSKGQRGLGKGCSDSGSKSAVAKKYLRNGKLKDVPLWCCIPGTQFRVVMAFLLRIYHSDFSLFQFYQFPALDYELPLM